MCADPWQHAGSQQNGQQQLATDENQVSTVENAACAYQKQTTDNTAYAG